MRVPPVCDNAHLLDLVMVFKKKEEGGVGVRMVGKVGQQLHDRALADGE